jgi:hypothetical protein
MALWRTPDLEHPGLGPVRGTTGQPAESSGDAITAFAGLIVFAYYHVIGLVLWLKVEPFRECVPTGAAHDDRVLGSDLPEHVRDGQPEPCRRETGRFSSATSGEDH